MNEELKYSDNGLLNKDIFFNNDINFYIEDEEKEYFVSNWNFCSIIGYWLLGNKGLYK